MARRQYPSGQRMRHCEGALAGAIALRATPFAALPLQAIKDKETKKSKSLTTLIHNCWRKIQQPALAQYWIGRVAQYSIGADTQKSLMAILEQAIVNVGFRQPIQAPGIPLFVGNVRFRPEADICE